jgi:hypothetical protein
MPFVDARPLEADWWRDATRREAMQKLLQRLRALPISAAISEKLGRGLWFVFRLTIHVRENFDRWTRGTESAKAHDRNQEHDHKS